MRITVTDQLSALGPCWKDHTVTVENLGAETFNDYVLLAKAAAVALGYAPKTVEELKTPADREADIADEMLARVIKRKLSKGETP